MIAEKENGLELLTSLLTGKKKSLNVNRPKRKKLSQGLARF